MRRGSGAGDSEGRVDRFVRGLGGNGDGDAPGRAGLTEGERAPPPPVLPDLEANLSPFVVALAAAFDLMMDLSLSVVPLDACCF